MHYDVVVDPNHPNSLMMIYNPESVVKVQAITDEERLWFLLQAQKYEEALADYEKNKAHVYSKYFPFQIVNGLMFTCLKERQLARMKQLLK